MNTNYVYKYFKGGLYKFVAFAQDATTLGDLVIYRNLDDGKVWVRDADEFFSTVVVDGKEVYRFERLTD